jgi:hypothetical protein
MLLTQQLLTVGLLRARTHHKRALCQQLLSQQLTVSYGARRRWRQVPV